MAGSNSEAILSPSAKQAATEPSRLLSITLLQLDDQPASEPNLLSDAQDVSGAKQRPPEVGGRQGLEPTRYGDWERGGRCIDF